MKTIAEAWAEWEQRHGKRIVIKRAYPIIGRGSVVHDWLAHDDIEKRFAKALDIPFLTRVKWFLNRILSHV